MPLVGYNGPEIKFIVIIIVAKVALIMKNVVTKKAGLSEIGGRSFLLPA